jgi:ATP-dependent Lon protease
MIRNHRGKYCRWAEIEEKILPQKSLPSKKLSSHENKSDIDEIKPNIEGITFHYYVKEMIDVSLKIAIIRTKSKTQKNYNQNFISN